MNRSPKDCIWTSPLPSPDSTVFKVSFSVNSTFGGLQVAPYSHKGDKKERFTKDYHLERSGFIMIPTTSPHCDGAMLAEATLV